MNATATKTYYAGGHSGEVVCLDCAGVTLKSAMQAKPNAKTLKSYNETFYALTAEEVSELVEIGLLCRCK
jgi:hypothetical protein